MTRRDARLWGIDFGRHGQVALHSVAWSAVENARRAEEARIRALMLGSSDARPWDLTLVVDDPLGSTYLLSRPSTLSELTTARALRRLGVQGPRPVELPRRSWRYKQPDILSELRDYLHRTRPHTWLYRMDEPSPAERARAAELKRLSFGLTFGMRFPGVTPGGAPGELELRLARHAPEAFRRTAARRAFSWSEELREEARR